MSFPLLLLSLTIFAGLCRLTAWLHKRKGMPCWSWIPWCGDFFTVLFVVLCIRSFIVEPFRIPSSSMVPTLKVGDFIAVNKFVYGLRLPVVHWKIFPISEPHRGDIVVFRYPLNPGIDYIKRVIGLPGDEIRYTHQQLFVNGQPITHEYRHDYLSVADQSFKRLFIESLPQGHTVVRHWIAHNVVPPMARIPYGYMAKDSHCRYGDDEIQCHVPPGHYFMMGDNRDNSADSRFWGFVPEDHILGKAFFIWFHATHLLPPEGFDWSRLGPLSSSLVATV